MPSDVIKRVHQLAIIKIGMQFENQDQSAAESEIEGVPAHATIEAVQAYN